MQNLQTPPPRSLSLSLSTTQNESPTPPLNRSHHHTLPLPRRRRAVELEHEHEHEHRLHGPHAAQLRLVPGVPSRRLQRVVADVGMLQLLEGSDEQRPGLLVPHRHRRRAFPSPHQPISRHLSSQSMQAIWSCSHRMQR